MEAELRSCFTDVEIKEIEESSLRFPQTFCENDDWDSVSEILAIESMGGMAQNNGTPNEIAIIRYRKDKEAERLTYKLSKTETIGAKNGY